MGFMQVSNIISSDVKPIAEPQTKAGEADDGFDFDDFIDVINPLQHLPVVGSIYRAITGDEIEAPAKIAGGALFGGFYGFLSALGSLAYEGIAGESFENSVLSLFEDAPAAAPQLAQRAYQSAQALSSDEIERAPFYAPAAPPVRVVALEI